MQTIQDALQSSQLDKKFHCLYQRKSFLDRITRTMFEYYCRALFKFYCPLTVHGRSNLPKSPFVLCSNHCSHMDSGILMAASGKSFDHFAMMAAQDYFYHNKKRWRLLSMFMDMIPVDRNPSFQTIIENLTICREFTQRRGQNLIIYPEGTRSVTGNLQEFKKGAAMLALELRVPIVPVYIDGTFKSWRKGSLIMKPTKITAAIGKAIYPEFFINGKRNFKGYRDLTNTLKTEIIKLKEQTNGRT